MLKDIRESRGLSQQDLADASGILKRQIQVFEQGYRDINGAKITTLLSLAIALKCSLADIVSDDNIKTQLSIYEGRGND